MAWSRHLIKSFFVVFMHFIHGSVCLFCACVFDVFSRLLVLNTSARDCLETNCVRNDLLCVEWDIKLTHSPMDT